MKHLKTYKIFESTKERDRELLQEYFNISYPEIEEIIQPVLNEYPELDWKISIINKKLFQIIFTKENISKEKYPFSTRLINSIDNKLKEHNCQIKMGKETPKHNSQFSFYSNSGYISISVIKNI